MSSIYELQLEIAAPAESQLETAENDVELVYSAHGPTHFLTIWQEAATPLSAAMIAIAQLRNSGIKVHRAVEDLVSRQDIADRLNVSRQAVGNWIRGERRGSEGEAFPNPYNAVGGGVWLWKDVNDWAHGIAATDHDVEHLAAIDYVLINHWIHHDDLVVWTPSSINGSEEPISAWTTTDKPQLRSL
ncbi:hypothetical protein ACIGB6_06135 [Paeniglutamicibacter gangotriensis]|uniref:Helix-turn-helix transcriptional regulator n=1 Tax=Paeniglutamicibacter gangotriensis TaxID=254787 RepID=A0A5B0E6Z5_9MICC|nr:helix-turn-helix transcriptional regulator [Paeniglutamicibacter gangotriensis]KAA0974754.1 helix-turn-helix transcriptional regulator [Paeniglutamicibacter gangotriensis]